MDSDSLWLQKSINLSDPFEEKEIEGRVSQTSNPSSWSPAEIEAIASKPQETLLPMRISGGARQLPRTSSTRMSSLANVMGTFSSPFEVDELKAKVAQLNREKLKWDDASRDLERIKAELKQARDDYKTLEEYTQSIKQMADESNRRAERDAKLRHDADAKLLETMRNASREQQLIKAQMDDALRHHAHAEFELREKFEAEKNQELERLMQEHNEVAASLEGRIRALESELSASQAAVEHADERIRQLKREVTAATEKVAAVEAQSVAALANLKHEMAQLEAKHHAASERAKAEHHEHIETTKALAAEQAFQLREDARCQVETLTSKLLDADTRCERLKDDVYRLKSELQAKELQMTKEKMTHDLALQKLDERHSAATLRATEEHRTEIDVLQKKLSATEAELRSISLERRATEEQCLKVSASLRDCERALAAANAEVKALDEKLQSAVCDIEVRDGDLDELTQLVQRMHADKDSEVTACMEDLQEARSRAQKAEEELANARAQLSAERKAHLAADGAFRKTIVELREQFNDASNRSVEDHTSDYENRRSLELACHQLTSKVSALEQEKLAMDSERASLSAELLQLRQQVLELEQQSSKRNRCLADVDSNRSREPSVKKSRVEEKPRVFAISGFDGADLQFLKSALNQLPNCRLVECRSNQAIPDGVSHLIASGTLTVKLLTAAAKGCWVLPKRYVDDSIAAASWLPEQGFGFKHDTPPLCGKAVYFSNQFKSKRHYENARLLVEHGGAVVTSDPTEADLVLCMAAEAKDAKSHTWEKLVHEVYPLLA